jgi:Tol biopolymer transport system component
VALAIRTLDTGQTRYLHPRLVYFKLHQWSPDGRSVIGQGTDGKGREGVFGVDVQTGAAAALVVASGQEALLWPQWLPDGKRIVYLRLSTSLTGDRTIMSRDVDSGEDRELLRGSGDLRLPFAVSPDGRHLAAATYDRTSRQSTVLLVPVHGGASREALRAEGPPAIVGIVGWTPDSRSIIFGKAETTPGSWWLALDGGPPRKVDFNHPKADGYLQVHPDGKRIVFQVSNQTAPQVWVLENLLPAVRTAASPQH